MCGGGRGGGSFYCLLNHMSLATPTTFPFQAHSLVLTSDRSSPHLPSRGCVNWSRVGSMKEQRSDGVLKKAFGFWGFKLYLLLAAVGWEGHQGPWIREGKLCWPDHLG